MAGKRFSDSDKTALSWIFKNTKPHHPIMLGLIICNCVYASTSAVFALLCRGIVDGATGHDKSAVIKCGAELFGVILLQLILRLACNSAEEVVTARTEMTLRSRLLSTLMKKESSAVSKYHSGEILNRMFSDIQIVADNVTNILPNLVNMITRLVCAVVVLVTLDASFTVVFLVGGVLLFFVAKIFRKRIKHLHKDVQKYEGRVRSFLQETVENLLIVKVFGTEEKMSRINDKNQSEHYRARMKRRTVSICANAGFGFVFQIGYLYAMLWGARGIFLGAMTYGTLTAILQLVNQIQTPFANLSALLPKFYGMTASAERIIEIENLPDEPPAQKTLSYSDFKSVDFSHTDFSYGENHVLSDVNISINKGDFVSLTGISGGGKSTMFLLIMGAYQPTGGSVKFTATDGSYRAGRETRGLIAYVPQGNILFSGTVRENISFLNEQADEEQIRAAAKTACALEFIEDFPDGFETKIGENGFGVSEGQAQRIAIARAVLGGAPIILLDEATSALDETTEAQVLTNIAGLKDKTLLIVTHRPAALKICGKRLIIRDGKVSYA